MEKTWAASYPLLTQKAFLPLIGWILLLMKGQIHNVEDQSSWYCHLVPVLKCFKINMGCMTKKRGPNKNHRVQKVKNMVHKIQHGVYDTTGPYKHRAVLIWQVRVDCTVQQPNKSSLKRGQNCCFQYMKFDSMTQLFNVW